MKIGKQNSIFSFFISKEKSSNNPTYDFENACNIGELIFYSDSRTPLQYSENNGREIIVFGYAANVFSGQSEGIAETVLKSTKSLDEVIEYEKKLGGKYVIFYAENGKCFCIGDATCSIPIFYNTDGDDFICSCFSQLIVNRLNLKKDKELQQIRNSGKLGQAMPYDTTPYKEIKRLLPNHYLDIESRKPVRFINSCKKQEKITSVEAVRITSPMIENIIKMFSDNFKIYCPLTGGKDSRVIYAYLKKLNNGNVDSYTVWLDRFNSDRQDWDIAAEIVKIGKTNHKQISLGEVTQEEKALMDELLGEGGYPPEAFSLSLAIQKHYGDGAITEGDILGQVGKCSLHRDIPNWLASPRYFRCKLHNYSDGARKYMRKWMNEVKDSEEHINIMDLFSVENRLGVWAAYTHLVRNTIGLVNLNCFNSRSIIYTWTAIDSSERMKGNLNVELIKNAYPEILSIPFGKDSKPVRIAKTNALTFYLASFLKYYIERRKFRKQQ
mgnify:CR=1 FL=1